MNRFEPLNQDEEFARRINHETGRIESVCLYCYATVAATSDIAFNALREKTHTCLQKELSHQRGKEAV